MKKINIAVNVKSDLRLGDTISLVRSKSQDWNYSSVTDLLVTESVLNDIGGQNDDILYGYSLDRFDIVNRSVQLYEIY
jgi:hypothetical protein